MATLVNLSRSLNFWRGLVATVNRIKSEQSFLLSYLCVAKRIPSHQLLAGRFVKQTAKRKAIPAFSRPSVQKREEEGGIHRRGMYVCVCVRWKCARSLNRRIRFLYHFEKTQSARREAKVFELDGWLVAALQPTNEIEIPSFLLPFCQPSILRISPILLLLFPPSRLLILFSPLFPSIHLSTCSSSPSIFSLFFSFHRWCRVTFIPFRSGTACATFDL